MMTVGPANTFSRDVGVVITLKDSEAVDLPAVRGYDVPRQMSMVARRTRGGANHEVVPFSIQVSYSSDDGRLLCGWLVGVGQLFESGPSLAYDDPLRQRISRPVGGRLSGDQWSNLRPRSSRSDLDIMFGVI
jgi:hypothetical protein